MGEKKLHYKMYKDGKKFVFAAIATMSFVVFGGVSTVAVHADTTSGNLTAATVKSTSDTKSAAQSAATVASSASDKKSAAQPAATVASSASDKKSAAQPAATVASSASDKKSAAQPAATAASSSSATKADSTSASSSSAMKADSTGASSSAGKADSTGAGTTARTATNGDATFPAVVSPVVPGYVADKAQVAAVTVDADSPDVNETVTYTKVGSLVPSSSDQNFPGAPTVVYPNDPSDATKVTPAGVPTVPGYTAHDPEGHVLTPGSSYQPSDPTKDTTITYTADKQKGSVSYVDDTTGKTLKTDSISGTTGSKSSYSTSGSIADYKTQGYELVTDGYPAELTFDNDDTTDQNFTVHLKHQNIQSTEAKTVTETIHYQGAGNQTPADNTAQVTFTRQVSTDAVTGEKTYGPWSADQSFAAVTSPELKGYTADKAQIDKQTVNGDSKDLEFTVTYTKTPVAGGNVTAKYVDENGNPIADDVIASGNVGDPYSTTQKDVPGYTFKEVQGNPTGSFTDQDQTVTYVYTKNPATDNNGGTGLNQPGKPGNGTDTGNSSSNQPGNPSQPSNATNNGVINTSTNTGSKVNNGAVNSPELPQTGENNSQSQTMSFIGILLAMFGSLLGFLGIKKRRND
ncbi:mucin-binding protein [Levilactobacillus lindianensis]|uniref:mucin-binding protein n=1 Tax=Levilactobacillus lindianensis TaxID=2486018 RepID=UPI000F73C607|nr:MucBP domain-containing protein [Levilactobacillus lindianensis]